MTHSEEIPKDVIAKHSVIGRMLKQGFARKNNRRSITLVELILVIAIVAILFPVMISSLFNPVVDSIWGDQMVRAMALAQEKMEEIYATKANSSVFLGYSYVLEANYPDEIPIIGYQLADFTRTVAVTEVSGTDLSTAFAESGFKKIVVTVTWGNAGDNVALTGVIADY